MTKWRALATDPEYLKAAFRDLGLSETPGPRHSARVLQLFKAAGHPEVKDDETAWCAAAVGGWLAESDFPNSGSLMARSYAKYGRGCDLSKPVPRGAIIVWPRGAPPSGHVNICLEDDGAYLTCIGGNQGNGNGGGVTVSRELKRHAMAARLPVGVAVSAPHKPPQTAPPVAPVAIDTVDSDASYPATPRNDGKLILETKRKLDELGYHEFGILNSDWGGRTVAAISAYKLDRGMTGPAEIDDALTAQLNKDIADNWTRPMKDERSNATVSDLAPHNETIKQNWWTRLWAKIVAIPAGIGAAISGVMNNFPDAKANYIDPAMSFFADVPGWLWFVAAGGIAAAIWVGTRKADSSVVKDFQDGRLLR